LRFSIEENFLTTSEEKPARPDPGDKIRHKTIEAETLDEALEMYLVGESAEALDVVMVRGTQAIATTRKGQKLYVVQVARE
jgi:hypothetical protein